MCSSDLLTVDKVPEDKLRPLPHDQGLAVSVNYENRQKEHMYGGAKKAVSSQSQFTARGEKGRKKESPKFQNFSAKPSAKSKSSAKLTVKQTPTGQQSFRCLTAEALPVKEVVDSVCATYEQRKRGVNESLDQEVEVTALFMGPFALDHIVQEKADYWRARLEEEYSLRLDQIGRASCRERV